VRLGYLAAMQEDMNEAHFREMAGKCRRLASTTDDPRAIESLSKLAEEYDKAAEAAAANIVLNSNANDRPRRGT
jgi:hypothetical protein